MVASITRVQSFRNSDKVEKKNEERGRISPSYKNDGRERESGASGGYRKAEEINKEFNVS
jgi:hypothetical protein